jgi:hypothetical protein
MHRLTQPYISELSTYSAAGPVVSNGSIHPHGGLLVGMTRYYLPYNRPSHRYKIREHQSPHRLAHLCVSEIFTIVATGSPVRLGIGTGWPADMA